MAYSPFEKRYNSLNRSRSSSCSSPKSNRIFYQQVYSNGNDTLVRSFSCDQFVDKNDKGQTYQTVNYQISNFITPTKQFKKSVETDKTWSLPKTLAIDYPNEEVKPSARHSLKYPDRGKLIETDSLTTGEKSDVTGCKIKSKMSYLVTGVKYVIVPILIWCLTNGIVNLRQCHQSWDVTHLSNKLTNSVFGQNEAVSKIINLINDFNENENSFVFMFTGDVGVGKTYTASIISQNLPWGTSKLLSFTNPINYMGESNVNENFLSCGANLMIIDDIAMLDSTRAVMLTKKILNDALKGRKTLVILIFKIQNKEQENLVLTQFQTSEISFYHLPFRNLKRDDIMQCFNTEIKRLQVDVPEKKLMKLVEEQMTYIDVLRGSPGCKGISDQLLKFYSI